MQQAPRNEPEPRRVFRFVGGALCLDFCNSVGGKRGKQPRECLNHYGDLLSWSEQALLIERSSLDTLQRNATSNPAAAAEVLGRAVVLREGVYRIFMAIRDGKKPAERDLETLNRELGRSLSRLRVVPGKNGFGWAWEPARGALDYPLGPIARSAGELLTSAARLRDLRQCRGENCGWIFLDSSKNHSRSWCDMRDCGNRAKVRRHRMRHKMKP